MATREQFLANSSTRVKLAKTKLAKTKLAKMAVLGNMQDSPELLKFAEPCWADSPESPTFAETCCGDSPDSSTFTKPCCADSPDSRKVSLASVMRIWRD
jgi:hypothetical protein